MSARQKPRYQQLKDLIITQISSGELRPHDRVPSENELVERMNVSRMTANRALRELTDEEIAGMRASAEHYVENAARHRAGLTAIED